MSILRLGSEQVFAALEVYHDVDSRSAALNMAIDEALLETAPAPTIRFYRWKQPALSFGYFGKFTDVVNYGSERDIVRRWTGGGIVFHGDDLTYSLVIPSHDPAFLESSMSIYEKTHAAIRAALVADGKDTELAEQAAPKISEACFSNAVRADVLLNGEKIAGAAQRRTRRGLLQQGSLQHVDLGPDFEKNFAARLSAEFREQTLDRHVLDRAHRIAEEKYATSGWLRRR
jgi:lipoyl(octanoyl) transferase